MELEYFGNLPIRSAEALDDPGEVAVALLRAANSGGIGVFVWEIPGGRMLWNDTMYEVYGIDRSNFSDRADAWLATLHPEDLPRVQDAVVAALKGVRPYDIVFRVRGDTGGWRYVKGTAWIERDEGGRAIRMAGINQDVTDSHRFHALVEAIEHGTATAVGQAFFQSLVKAIVRTLGVRYATVAEVYPSDEPTHARAVATCLDGELVDTADRELAHTPYLDIVHAGLSTFPSDVRRLFPNDTLLAELDAQCCVGVPLQSAEGKPLGVLMVLDNKPGEDLELARKLLELFAGRAGAELERLRREEEVNRLNADLEARVAARTSDLARTMRELEAFTYSVSHDLGAPLRAIQGFGAVLIEDYADKLDSAGQDYLHRTIGAAERMGRLIEDLVSLSKISLRPLNIGKIDLVPLAQSIMADLQAQKPRPAMQFNVPAHLVVHADAGLMRLLLDCLLRNAWKFTEMTRNPCIELVERQHEGRREIVLKDNGVGFDAATAQRLFAPFQTFHVGGGFSGSGTGLAIAQRVVHRHHGGIHADSEVGLGASFVFWLPPAPELMALLASETK
ncbi:MAG: PAS domain-containing protein [Burkholderiales bacterium]|nr:PAS domain-containing protein [Burkholderiales bacterium]